MKYRIPSEDILAEAVKRVIGRTVRVNSQSELTSLVNKELAKYNSKYRAGGERIRRVAIDRNLVKIEIEYHESDDKGFPDICPVCKNAMTTINNMTLDGKIVEIKRKCTVCPYSMGRAVMIPRKYAFVKVIGKETSDMEKRIKDLKKARALMHQASSLVEHALHMTGLNERGAETVNLISELADSKIHAGSVVNLIKDLEYKDNTDPLWTRPVASVKNVNRKDI